VEEFEEEEEGGGGRERGKRELVRRRRKRRRRRGRRRETVYRFSGSEKEKEAFEYSTRESILLFSLLVLACPRAARPNGARGV